KLPEVPIGIWVLFDEMRENPASGFVSNWRISDGLSRTPRADHGIMTVWGKSCQAASGSKARADAVLSASAQTLAIEWFDQGTIQTGRKHGFAVIGLCVGCERQHVGS